MPRVNRAEGAVALVTGANAGSLGLVEELLERGRARSTPACGPAALADEFDKLTVTSTSTSSHSTSRMPRASPRRERCADLTMACEQRRIFRERRLVLTDDLEAARQEMR